METLNPEPLNPKPGAKGGRRFLRDALLDIGLAELEGHLMEYNLPLFPLCGVSIAALCWSLNLPGGL